MIEKKTYLQIHLKDNVLVALQDLKKGQQITFNNSSFLLIEEVSAKHKFTIGPLRQNEGVYMYGVLVGKAKRDLEAGSLITTFNLQHAAEPYALGERKTAWQAPDISAWKDKKFMGYHRSNGSVGTANYWLVIPLVFCENRNVEVLKEALVKDLGYEKKTTYNNQSRQLIELFKTGKSVQDILSVDLEEIKGDAPKERIFPNLDGIKFLTHEQGCGGTRQDSDALCGLLAGYITHPNVAGATILSLGCQHAQVSILQEEIKKRDPDFDKPLVILEQQKIASENKLLSLALKQTFAGLIEANKLERKPAPLSKLVIGLECGGSDGFSGISANPAIGFTSDLVVSVGGTVILSEFPELCGVEQELSDRCVDETTAKRFIDLMKSYNKAAEAVGSGFDMNPSPGNIKDGLITDAIKSVGAAKKGGLSPIMDVLDYPEKVKKAGLNLLCTPGNDVESTTAEVAAGATVVLFTTGLGTPTGNPIAPVVKIASSSSLFNRMSDIIDINTGSIIEGEETVEAAGERILKFIIKVASGEIEPKAVQLGQDDFIPWKRGVSL